MGYVISPPLQPVVAVKDSVDLFPVHRIYCVGRNYAAHAIEMGHDPDREDPFFFQKNPDSIVPNKGKFPYPSESKNVQHEVELVIALKVGGTNIDNSKALDCIYGYAVGIDMTRRDLQSNMKKQGRPWEIGKAFEYAAPCSHIVQVSNGNHPNQGAIWLNVNGETKQSGNLNQMIWKTPEIIAYLSRLFALMPGDLIYSGTPAGVGPIVPGDHLNGGVEGVGEIDVKVI